MSVTSHCKYQATMGQDFYKLMDLLATDLNPSPFGQASQMIEKFKN